MSRKQTFRLRSRLQFCFSPDGVTVVECFVCLSPDLGIELYKLFGFRDGLMSGSWQELTEQVPISVDDFKKDACVLERYQQKRDPVHASSVALERAA